MISETMTTEVIKLDTESMTLQEICDLTEVRHDNAMMVIPKLLEIEGFGLAPEFQEPYTSGKGRVDTRLTYRFDHRQSMIVAARLSNKFLIRVVDRWLALEEQTRSWDNVRLASRTSYKIMSDALLENRKSLGKSTTSFHYSNEARMINAIMGLQSKNARDELSSWVLKALDNLTVFNTTLINAGMTYKERKGSVASLYGTMVVNNNLLGSE